MSMVCTVWCALLRSMLLMGLVCTVVEEHVYGLHCVSLVCCLE